MKKRVVVIFIAIVALTAVLFVPIPQGQFRDGGTEVFSALTYKVVKWRRLVPAGTGVEAEESRYEKTSVYWFPDSMKSIDELWEIERNQ